ncbi:MAG: sugar phosphate isomerase/epimerase, partial [Bacillota bacterium]|nr:sugar phosphate isomerase/epimerase [Bacillota bacterium]
MDRLIASTMTYRAASLETALKRLKEEGFKKAELCTVVDWIPHFRLINATDETIEEAAKMIEGIGIEIPAINVSGIGNVDDNNNFIGTAVLAMNNAFKLAVRLGAKVVTLACGEIKPEHNREERLKAITAFNTLIADMAEKYSVTYSIEAPHKLSIAEKTEEIAEYWAKQDKRIKCTFDVAHLTFAGIDPVQIAKVYVNRVAHVHLRDAV